jgi:hypothetical protein
MDWRYADFGYSSAKRYAAFVSFPMATSLPAPVSRIMSLQFQMIVLLDEPLDMIA